MSSRQNFKYSEDVLHHLYAQHQMRGQDGFGSYEGFRNCLIGRIDDIGVTIFDLLPKAELADFYSGDILYPEDIQQLSGLANLLQIPAERCPFDLDPDALPDISFVFEEGSLVISTFQNNIPDIFAMGEQAARVIWENFDVKQMESFTEEEQRVFLRMINLLDLDFSDEKVLGRHKHLVFGLHIPQDLKDYHDECVKELGTRILTSPVYAGFFQSFVDKHQSKRVGLKFTQDEKARKHFVSFLMGEIANIWQLPEFIEDKLNKKPRKDKEGVKLETLAHAFYRRKDKLVEPKKEGEAALLKQAGLIFAVNSHGGYIPAKKQNYSMVHTLGHEAGHLMSDFMMVANDHKQWFETEPLNSMVRNNALLSMPEAKSTMSWNNNLVRSAFYYQPEEVEGVKIDGFSGLEGMRAYRGQLEERHADYVGEQISEMVEFALEWKLIINSYDDCHADLEGFALSVMSKAGIEDNDFKTYQLMKDLFAQSKTFEDLEERIFLFTDYMDAWIKQEMDVEKEYIQNEELKKAQGNKNITTDRMLFIKSYIEFKKLTTKVFDMRERMADAQYLCAQDKESALSL